MTLLFWSSIFFGVFFGDIWAKILRSSKNLHAPTCLRTPTFPVELATLVLKMLTPLQLPTVHQNYSCDGCARDAEENRMRKKS